MPLLTLSLSHRTCAPTNTSAVSLRRVLLSLPAPESSTILGHRLDVDARSRLHHVARGLLQCHACRITAVHMTHFTVCWTLQPVSSLALESSIRAYLVFCMMNCTVPERMQYKLAVTIHRCLQNKAPMYLVDCCIPVSDVASRQHLRSASRHFLTVPRFRRNTFGRQTFSVGGPMAWNSLPDSLRDHHTAAIVSGVIWRRLSSRDTSVPSALEMLHDNALYKFNIDIDNDIEHRSCK